MAEISSTYYRLPVRDQQARAQLDAVRRCTPEGIEQGEGIVMEKDAKGVSLPYEQHMHAGLLKDLNDEMLRIINLANDVQKMDPKTADMMFEAVAIVAQAQATFDRQELKTAMAKRDQSRQTAFGDYWRNNTGKISRY